MPAANGRSLGKSRPKIHDRLRLIASAEYFKHQLPLVWSPEPSAAASRGNNQNHVFGNECHQCDDP